MKKDFNIHERVVLASILNRPQSILKVQDIVRPEQFHMPHHSLLYQILDKLYTEHGDIRLVDVMGRALEVGVPVSVIESLQEVGPHPDPGIHARRIVEFHKIRQLYHSCKKVLGTKVLDLDIVYNHFKEVEDIIEDTGKQDIRHVRETIGATYKNIEARRKGEIKLLGMPTGFKFLDRKVGGFKGGDLVVIAGRPGSGKTAFSTNIAYNLSKDSRPVLLFSLEMSSDQINTRLLSGAARISNDALFGDPRLLTEHQASKLEQWAERISKLPIYVDDSDKIDIGSIVARSKRLKMRLPNLSAVIVDYIQLMRVTGEKMDRLEMLTEISIELKRLARSLDIPVIVLSQLNRDIEKRGKNARPRLSDLKGCGQIEQDADLILFCHMVDDPEQSQPCECEIIVGKGRNCALGPIPAYYFGSLTLFEERAKTAEVEQYG